MRAPVYLVHAELAYHSFLQCSNGIKSRDPHKMKGPNHDRERIKEITKRQAFLACDSLASPSSPSYLWHHTRLTVWSLLPQRKRFFHEQYFDCILLGAKLGWNCIQLVITWYIAALRRFITCGHAGLYVGRVLLVRQRMHFLVSCWNIDFLWQVWSYVTSVTLCDHMWQCDDGW